ncbi:MAG TPA: hypothetical protein VF867_11965 [Arthrobacter sp.]
MSQGHPLEDHAVEQLFRRAAHIYSSLLGTFGRPARPYGLFETLLHAYADMDSGALVQRLEALAADHGQALRSIIEDHSEGAANYVESRDWLYEGPEVLLVADLARSFPSRLRAVAVPSDFAAALETMADELSGK